MSFLFGAGIPLSWRPSSDYLLILVSPFCLFGGRTDGKKKHGWLQGREQLKVAALLFLPACLEEERKDQGWKNEGKGLDWNSLCVVNNASCFLGVCYG